MFEPGRVYHRRRDIHDRFGGQARGGISTPRQWPWVLLFTSPRGSEYGYRDGWVDDETFLFTGEGQEGDMEFTRGNRQIRDHARLGKELHLFEHVRPGYVRYLGRMVYESHFEETGPDVKGRPRRLIIFKLRKAEE